MIFESSENLNTILKNAFLEDSGVKKILYDPYFMERAEYLLQRGSSDDRWRVNTLIKTLVEVMGWQPPVKALLPVILATNIEYLKHEDCNVRLTAVLTLSVISLAIDDFADSNVVLWKDSESVVDFATLVLHDDMIEEINQQAFTNAFYFICSYKVAGNLLFSSTQFKRSLAAALTGNLNIRRCRAIVCLQSQYSSEDFPSLLFGFDDNLPSILLSHIKDSTMEYRNSASIILARMIGFAHSLPVKSEDGM